MQIAIFKGTARTLNRSLQVINKRVIKLNLLHPEPALGGRKRERVAFAHEERQCMNKISQADANEAA